MFKCERDGEVRSFETFAECRRFVRREGDQNRLWGYIGRAHEKWIESLDEPAYEGPSAREQYVAAWHLKQSLHR